MFGAVLATHRPDEHRAAVRERAQLHRRWTEVLDVQHDGLRGVRPGNDFAACRSTAYRWRRRRRDHRRGGQRERTSFQHDAPRCMRSLARCELFASRAKAGSVPRGRRRARMLHMLEVGQTIKLIEIGEAVRAALREPGAPEQPPIFGRRAFVPSIVVAGHGVFGREGFDVGGAADQPANRAESAFGFSACRRTGERRRRRQGR